MKREHKRRPTKIYSRGNMRGKVVEATQPEPQKPKKPKGEDRPVE